MSEIARLMFEFSGAPFATRPLERLVGRHGLKPPLRSPTPTAHTRMRGQSLWILGRLGMLRLILGLPPKAQVHLPCDMTQRFGRDVLREFVLLEPHQGHK